MNINAKRPRCVTRKSGPGRCAGGRGEQQQAVGGYYDALLEWAHVVDMMEPLGGGTPLRLARGRAQTCRGGRYQAPSLTPAPSRPCHRGQFDQGSLAGNLSGWPYGEDVDHVRGNWHFEGV